MNIKIGTKIRQLRKQIDITQERLAEALGVTGQAVSRWESENGYPDMDYITSIAKYFDVTTDFLFDHTIASTKQETERVLLDVAKKLQAKGMKLDEISEITGLPVAKLMRQPDDMLSLLHIDPILLCFGYGLIPLAESDFDGNLMERIVSIRREIALEFGVIIPMIRLRDDIHLSPKGYAIIIHGIEAMHGTINEDTEAAESSAEIAAHLSETVKKHLYTLISRQDVHKLINNIKESHPILIEELIPKHLSIGEVQKVLTKLLKEGVSIRNLVSILETLADYAPITRDTDMLTEYVRTGLRRAISHKFFSSGEHSVIVLDPTLEQTLTGNIQKTEAGSFVNITPELSEQIFESLKTETAKLNELGVPPIILTSPFVRMYFKQLVDEVAPDLTVISYGEIDPGVKLLSVGSVTTDKSASEK